MIWCLLNKQNGLDDVICGQAIAQIYVKYTYVAASKEGLLFGLWFDDDNNDDDDVSQSGWMLF